MRKTTYIYAIACVMVVIFGSTSCTDEYLMKSSTQTELKDFSLQEARDFFTKQIEETTMLSRSIDNKQNKGMSPGDFVPDWNSSVGSSMNGLACYDIPIAPTYRYKAVYVDERNGLPSAGKVSVYQKLVIVKDVKSKELSQYILTLIPSKACDNKYGSRLCSNFINCADKGGFTGVAIYSCVNSNMTVRVSKYKDGKKIDGVFLLNATSKTDFANKYEHAYSLVSNVAVQKKSMLMTRGEMEEEPSWDGGSLSEVVITPEPDLSDWGQKDMEDWLESSRPNGTVDPEPSVPEGPVIPEEDVVSGNEGEQNPEEKSVPLSAIEQKKVNGLLDQLEKLKNIDRTKYTIEKQNYCRSTARTGPNGELLLCEMFFKSKDLQEIDRLATIWHEMYHIDHKHIAKLEMYKLAEPIILTPPPHIEKVLNERLNAIYGNIYVTPEARQADLEQDLIITNFSTIEFYKREIEAHGAERESFPVVSPYYENERTWLEWFYGQMLEIATEQQKK